MELLGESSCEKYICSLSTYAWYYSTVRDQHKTDFKEIITLVFQPCAYLMLILGSLIIILPGSMYLGLYTNLS